MTKTTSEFHRPTKPRFDKDQATDGVWFYISDEVGNEFGGFKCTLFDPSIPRVRIAVERAQRQSAAKSKLKRTGDVSGARDHVELFVDLCLVDWDMKDGDGKSKDFSRDAAIRYFMTNEKDESGESVFVYDRVFTQLFGDRGFARDIMNYQTDEQNEAGDPLGNS